MSSSTVVVQAIANAIKSSGVVVEVEREDFLTILRQSEKPLIVHASSKILRTTHRYLTSYKGLAFYTKVSEPLDFLMSVELVEAKKIVVPDL